MNEKPNGMTIEGIRKIIEASGYPLEIDIANVLRQQKWTVFHQYPYRGEAQKIRLVDLYAMNPNISEPRVSMLIECKKSAQHGWAFHTIEKRGEIQSLAALWIDFLKKTRGYDVKAEPSDEIIPKLQLEGFHLADPETKMGTLCCIPPKHPDDFYEAVYQILDALTHIPRRSEVVFPVVVFEGPMWSFRKDKYLDIHDIDYLQYISTSPDEGSAQLIDVVRKSYFEEFLGHIDRSVEWLRRNLVKREPAKQVEKIRL